MEAMRRSALPSLALSALALATASCTRVTGGSAPTPTLSLAPIPARPPAAEARAERQVGRGTSVYTERCGRCHDAEEVVGRPLDAAILAAYLTPRALFDYVSTQMPPERPGALPAEDYWDALAFLLRSREMLPVGVVLGPANADTLRLRR